MSQSKCEVRAEITYRVYNVAIGYSFKEKALLCPSVGIGRQSGLRNRGLNGLRVRVSPWVQQRTFSSVGSERYPYKVDVGGSNPSKCTIIGRWPSG